MESISAYTTSWRPPIFLSLRTPWRKTANTGVLTSPKNLGWDKRGESMQRIQLEKSCHGAFWMYVYLDKWKISNWTANKYPHMHHTHIDAYKPSCMCLQCTCASARTDGWCRCILYEPKFVPQLFLSYGWYRGNIHITQGILGDGNHYMVWASLLIPMYLPMNKMELFSLTNNIICRLYSSLILTTITSSS